jgi:hypothetical protein
LRWRPRSSGRAGLCAGGGIGGVLLGLLSRGGTVSNGAALGNVIAGALAILAAPPLAWLAIRRLLSARHRVRDDFTSSLA